MKRKKRLKKKIFRLFTLLFLILLTLGCKNLLPKLQEPNKSTVKIPSSFPLPSNKEKENSKNSVGKLNNIYSSNAILICLDDQKIIAEKNSEERIYPASLTKIMTAITVIDNLKDLDKQVLLPSEIFPKLYKADASMAGFLPGEKASAMDLLYGVLLPSGAECCTGLADYVAGSEDNFVQLMNQKAKKLDMTKTHFTNTTGLQSQNHYTTVKDLAVLLEYSLKNDVFRQIFTSSKHSVPPTNRHPSGFTFYSTMFNKLDNPYLDDGEILGGKTGHTDQAGLCLASLAKKDGKEYILVTVGADGTHNTKQYNICDAIDVYNNISY